MREEFTASDRKTFTKYAALSHFTLRDSLRIGALTVFVLLGMMFAPTEGPTAESGGSPERYALHGEVIFINHATQSAIIRHSGISGTLEATTMQYPVPDIGDFRSLRNRDCIHASLFVDNTRYWIADIRRTATDCVSAPDLQENQK